MAARLADRPGVAHPRRRLDRPGLQVLRLMASGGHTAYGAERQASRLPAFRAADPACIDLRLPTNRHAGRLRLMRAERSGRSIPLRTMRVIHGDLRQLRADRGVGAGEESCCW